MLKLAAAAASVLAGITLAALSAPEPQDRGGPPAKKAKDKGKGKAKKKEEAGPKGDLRRAYDLLRRLRADDRVGGRPEERIRDWTERAVNYYRDGLKALDSGDDFLAHEYGAIAHDLARATDHARNAALLDRRERDLPPPRDGFGPDDTNERNVRDLDRAYDRITAGRQGEPAPGAGFYVKASRDLYSAARRDLEAGRGERGGELARAAEAMTHVTEHLGHVADGPPGGRGRIGAGPAGRPAPPPTDPEPKDKRSLRTDSGLPPALPPEN
jgi:hypothetical protein